MLIYEKEPMKINYSPAKFGGHTHCGSKDTTLMRYVILQDHVIKGSCDFMGKSQSVWITILPSFVAIGTLIVKI